jgi:hypothetical protein
MTSMQTRIAQGAARDAEAEWKRHAVHCPRCSRPARDRAAELCGPGTVLRNESRRLRRAARHESELDKQVPEVQEPLF